MDAVLNWMKEFLIIYLILTILMHLAATEQYKKYLRFFCGMVLLLVLVSPVLRLVGKGSRLDVSAAYEAFWERLDDKSSQAQEPGILQDSPYMESYRQAVAQDISIQAKSRGILLGKTEVFLNRDYAIERVEVWLDISQEADAQGVEGRFRAWMYEAYGLEGDRVVVRM